MQIFAHRTTSEPKSVHEKVAWFINILLELLRRWSRFASGALAWPRESYLRQTQSSPQFIKTSIGIKIVPKVTPSGH